MFLLSSSFFVVRYRFNHTLSVDPWGPHYQGCASNVCHGVELAFVFCTAHVLGYNITSDEEALCVRMQDAWGAFVHGREEQLWPQYLSPFHHCIFVTTCAGTMRAMRLCTCGARRRMPRRSMCSASCARTCGIQCRIKAGSALLRDGDALLASQL